LIEKLEIRLPAAATAPVPLDIHPSNLREDEFATLIDLKEKEGVLHEAESIVLQEIIRLGDKRAREIITPRVDLFSIPDDLTNDEVIRMVRPKRFHRVPVRAGGADDIVGILDVKEFLLHPGRHYTELMASPSFVPETLSALSLMRGLLKQPRRMAVVLDEFGGTQGVVTLWDATEEILGDALPADDNPLYIEALTDGELLVSGNAPIARVFKAFDQPAPEKPGVRTVHQFLLDHCGHVPRTNSIVACLELEFDIRSSNRRRIREVLVRKSAPAGEGKN
jgi:putative hemolysin